MGQWPLLQSWLSTEYYKEGRDLEASKWAERPSEGAGNDPDSGEISEGPGRASEVWGQEVDFLKEGKGVV